MTEHVYAVTENEEVSHAAKVMAEHQVRRLVVLDDQKRIKGMISLGDIAASPENEPLALQVLKKVSASN
jgi:CBS domain-containing protein